MKSYLKVSFHTPLIIFYSQIVQPVISESWAESTNFFVDYVGQLDYSGTKYFCRFRDYVFLIKHIKH